MVMPMENLMPKGDSLTGAELVKWNKSSTVGAPYMASKSYKLC
jgi:hypothetical protein